MKLLPENPTQFDYLHAIRAVASRSGSDTNPVLKAIFNMANDGMMLPREPVANPNTLLDDQWKESNTSRE